MGYYYRWFLPLRDGCSYQQLSDEKVEVGVELVVVVFDQPFEMLKMKKKNCRDGDLRFEREKGVGVNVSVV